METSNLNSITNIDLKRVIMRASILFYIHTIFMGVIIQKNKFPPKNVRKKYFCFLTFRNFIFFLFYYARPRIWRSPLRNIVYSSIEPKITYTYYRSVTPLYLIVRPSVSQPFHPSVAFHIYIKLEFWRTCDVSIEALFRVR